MSELTQKSSSHDSKRVYSSIKSGLKTRLLFRGTLIAGIGAVILFFGGTMLPEEQLQVWGWPIAIVGFGLLAIGLIPFRQITRLESAPYQIETNQKELSFIAFERNIFTAPRASIASMDYREKGNRYGIAIWLHQQPIERVLIHDKSFYRAFQQGFAKKEFGCDLYLPYFTKRALLDLEY